MQIGNQVGTENRPALAAAVFAVGAAFPRGLNLILLPIYTAVLPPADYGELSVLLALGVAVSYIFSFGLDLAVFRTLFKLQDDEERRSAYIRRVWGFTVWAAPTAAGICALFAWTICDFLGIKAFGNVLLTLFAYATIAVASPIPLAVLRAQQRLQAFTIFSVCSAVISSGLIVLFVVVMGFGVRGWLTAMLFSNVFIFAVACLVVPFPRRGGRVTSELRPSLRLGISIVPHYLAHWSLQAADRFVLAVVATGTFVGLFSFAANLAIPALIAGQALNQAVSPRYAEAAHSEESLLQLPRVMLMQGAGVLCCCAGLALVTPPLVHIIAPSSYSGAGDALPWLIGGYAFLGLYYLPMNVVTLVYGYTGYAWLIPVCSAAGSLALLYIVAPAHNVALAAACSSTGYVALLIGISWYSARLNRQRGAALTFPLARLSLYAGCIAIFYVLGLTIRLNSASIELVCRGAFVFAVALSLYVVYSLKGRRQMNLLNS